MEHKTKVNAEDGKQQIIITRAFNLPIELLFKAYEDAEIIEQWMGTKVLKLKSEKHGSYQIETCDPKGNVAFRANGVIHEFIPNKKIIRTFEMEQTAFGVQLETFDFEEINANNSKLTMHIVFESVEQRDQLLKLPFEYGINMAHERLEKILGELQ